MIPYLSKGQGNIFIKEMSEKKNLDSQSLVYVSEAIKKMYQTVNKVANTDTSLLIVGKSGTGKEELAHLIHNKSYRKSRPFLVLNCSCLNENTIESELFGHEKGAFTGAYSKKIGILEKANEGTLVLDSIGDMKLRSQTKLLRFLQEGEIYRVGGHIPIRLNIRIIACTKRNLSQEVARGQFREDLYYRINTITIKLPSLSERKEDIPVLLKYFLGSTVEIEKEALRKLVNYTWPGNVRELKNICERMRILYNDQTVKSSYLPEEFHDESNTKIMTYDPCMTLAEINKIHILNAMDHFPSKRQAAKALGITVKTLYNRLHDYGLFEDYAIHSLTIKE